MKTSPLHFLSLFVFLFGSLSLNAAELATAKVTEVDGTVTLFREGESNQPLRVGDILRQGDAISATALSRADLVFSNGSTITIEENTSMTIAELEQQSFGGGKSYEQLEGDPSPSQTLLELNYGKLSGEVKDLRSDSTFHIDTPLGTAAIRGTIFWVELRYNAERGEMLLVINNISGIVDVISKYVGSIEYGEGNIGDKGYESSLSDDSMRREQIPDRHIVVIRLSRLDPYYNDIIDAIENYAPLQDEDDRPPVIIPLPGPVVTDEDGDVQVISPSGPDEVEDQLQQQSN